MSSNPDNKRRLSLPLHLTLWYAGIFTVSSLIIFTIIYIIISAILQNRTDDELRDDIDELSSVFNEEGINEFDAHVGREIVIHGKDKIFYRLIDINGIELFSTDISDWPGLEIENNLAQLVSNRQPLLKTAPIAGHRHKARIAYGIINNDLVIQIGYSLEKNDVFLDVLKNVFAIILPVLMFIAGFLGWFMAKKSLRGVNEVTEAAIHISQGELARRVPVSGRGDELDRLAVTFNSMLDRIQKLISGMQEMTDNIAHDLRSPLGRIRGMAETALTNAHANSDFQSIAADMVEECDRLLHMINTMLDITETEAGVASLKMLPVDLSSVIADACELFEPTAEDKEIELIREVTDKIIVYGNIHYLQRLISNLIDNALKYSHKGGKVHIR
ncbi:MAG TPA: HAMP domain-containing sensor histidine kinase, partial [Gammaproteobacteria bacterium]